MAFEGRLRLPHPVEALARHLPTLDNWLRLSPQWSLLALEPADDAHVFELRLRLDEDDREETYRAVAMPLADKQGWQLDLSHEGATRTIDLQLASVGPVSELILRDSDCGEGDGTGRTLHALWLRATADYILLAAGRSRRSRLSKWFLDRIWLRMNLTGRRVVILILAYEVIGLAFLIGWLIWERMAA